ncbi:hypothetical protein PM082_018255 [Marasmius tenuissimus]|nr:hypothetical protein PM082_018255 [Marasmius tenuissimus]
MTQTDHFFDRDHLTPCATIPMSYHPSVHPRSCCRCSINRASLGILRPEIEYLPETPRHAAELAKQESRAASRILVPTGLWGFLILPCLRCLWIRTRAFTFGMLFCISTDSGTYKSDGQIRGIRPNGILGRHSWLRSDRSFLQMTVARDMAFTGGPYAQLIRRGIPVDKRGLWLIVNCPQRGFLDSRTLAELLAAHSSYFSPVHEPSDTSQKQSGRLAHLYCVPHGPHFLRFCPPSPCTLSEIQKGFLPSRFSIENAWPDLERTTASILYVAGSDSRHVSRLALPIVDPPCSSSLHHTIALASTFIVFCNITAATAHERSQSSCSVWKQV